jgi:hypothetical protein
MTEFETFKKFLNREFEWLQKNLDPSDAEKIKHITCIEDLDVETDYETWNLAYLKYTGAYQDAFHRFLEWVMETKCSYYFVNGNGLITPRGKNDEDEGEVSFDLEVLFRKGDKKVTVTHHIWVRFMDLDDEEMLQWIVEELSKKAQQEAA